MTIPAPQANHHSLSNKLGRSINSLEDSPGEAGFAQQIKHSSASFRDGRAAQGAVASVLTAGFAGPNRWKVCWWKFPKILCRDLIDRPNVQHVWHRRMGPASAMLLLSAQDARFSCVRWTFWISWTLRFSHGFTERSFGFRMTLTFWRHFPFRFIDMKNHARWIFRSKQPGSSNPRSGVHSRQRDLSSQWSGWARPGLWCSGFTWIR